MRFYNRQHRHYCGIDLHVKTMYVCILDATGQVLVHRNMKSTPEAFLARTVRRVGSILVLDGSVERAIRRPRCPRVRWRWIHPPSGA